jgi:hypothetical protein
VSVIVLLPCEIPISVVYFATAAKDEMKEMQNGDDEQLLDDQSMR